jgi:hypothetical protein
LTFIKKDGGVETGPNEVLSDILESCHRKRLPFKLHEIVREMQETSKSWGETINWMIVSQRGGQRIPQPWPIAPMGPITVYPTLIEFTQNDGSYLSESVASAECDRHHKLKNANEKPFFQTGHVAGIIQVNRPTILGDTLTFISCTVAWIQGETNSGELADVLASGERLRSGPTDSNRS